MDLNYKIIGQGEPVLLLHGLFGSLDNLQSMANQLSQHYKVIMVDLRNHGKSPHSPNMSYSLMAEDIDNLCSGLELVRIKIIGHSMGGKVICQMMNSYPDRLESAVIIDIVPKKYPDGHHQIFKAMFALDLDDLKSRNEADLLLQHYIPEFAVRQFILKNLDRQEDQTFKWKLNLESIYNNYDKINNAVPITHVIDTRTLFIKGENSNYITTEDISWIYNNFSQVSVKSILHAGHWVHADNLTDLMKEINLFF